MSDDWKGKTMRELTRVYYELALKDPDYVNNLDRWRVAQALARLEVHGRRLSPPTRYIGSREEECDERPTSD
jgi:hypothetical protein